jgi:hypothetical protein
VWMTLSVNYSQCEALQCETLSVWTTLNVKYHQCEGS